MRKGRLTLSGTIYHHTTGLAGGSAIIEDGRVIETSDRTKKNADIEGTLIPSFVNAHTHLGDACIDAPPHGMTLASYVRPPDGFKHIMLARTPKVLKFNRVREYLISSFWNGITHIHDFREEGVDGIRMAKGAVRSSALPIQLSLYGRPTNDSSPDEVLSICDGFGLSSREDVGATVAGKLASLAHVNGKRFALHASEDRRVEIRPVLALRPTFIVHMCHALKEDLHACAKACVPIVVCPRSNAVFGKEPDVERMLDAGVAVMLGTDNASISTPDMFEEMRFLYLSKKRRVSPLDILDMATFTPRKIFKAGERFSLWDDALVLSKTFNDVESIMLKARTAHVRAIMTGGKLFRRLDT